MVQFAINRNNYVGQASANYPLYESPFIFVIEDLNLNNARIFIDKQPYDVNSLAFLNQERFHFNNRNLFFFRNDTSWQWNNSGVMYLSNHAISGTCWVEDAATPGPQWYLRGWGNMFHYMMDTATNPIRPMISLNSGNNYFYGMSQAYNVTPVAQQYGGLFGSDIVNNAIAMNSFGSTWTQFSGNGLGEKFIWEDTVNGVLWSQSHVAGATNYISYTSNYLTTGATTTIAVTGTAQMDYHYMGRDSANNLYFTQIQHNTANEPVTTSWINVSSRAVTAIISAQVPATSNSQTYNMTWPSNIRTDSSSRKVFYTMHWDSTNNLAPMRFVWNPTLVGNVSKVNCTMVYPGANAYTNYGAHGANTNAILNLNNSWFYRPYQFTIGTNNYITFTHNDMGAGWVANSATRFPNTASRSWITYQVGDIATANDNVLTYHSTLSLPTIFDMSHNWITVPGTSGNTIAMVNYKGINFYQFSETTGWTFESLYAGRVASVGFDQTYRCWAYMADTPQTAQGSLHIVTPTSNSAVPTNIAIVYANTNLVYSGSNVSTTATVNAYDSSNTRMVANLTLTIDGYSMQFSNGAKSGIVETSNSGDTTVNLTITGGGTSVIIPSVNI